MIENLTAYQIALTQLEGIGNKKAKILLSKFDSPEYIFKASLNELHALSGITKDTLRKIDRNKALELGIKHAAYFQKNGIKVHFSNSPDYPRRLKNCEDAPLVLYSKGNLSVNPDRCIAIVGTRTSSSYGRYLCEDLIEQLKDKNIQVVSGLAYGIDIIAHQASVKNKIETIGVLGHGLDRIYPREHLKTAKEMLHKGGLLSEYLPGTLPDREHFPMRNRIVAGLTDAVVVIESKQKGGSLITASLALDYNRDVFAYPGNVGQVQSEGCNQLIQQNKAQLVQSADDILNVLGWNSSPSSKSNQRLIFDELNEAEKSLCHHLVNSTGEHVDVLAIKTSLPISMINVHLFNLEMKGIIRPLPGKKYVLV